VVGHDISDVRSDTDFYIAHTNIVKFATDNSVVDNLMLRCGGKIAAYYLCCVKTTFSKFSICREKHFVTGVPDLRRSLVVSAGTMRVIRRASC